MGKADKKYASGAVMSSQFDYREAEFLEDMLRGRHTGSQGLTAEKLLQLDEASLLRYAPLVIADIEKWGALQSNVGKSTQTSLLNAFCIRAQTSRPLKLRAAILTHVAAVKGVSDLNPVALYDPSAYSDAMDHNLEEVKEEIPDELLLSKRSNTSLESMNSQTGSQNISVYRASATALLNDNLLLEEYVAFRFFHQKNGIELKTKRRWWNCKKYKNTFSERAALLFIMQDLNISEKATASAIGSLMEERNLIQRVDQNVRPKQLAFGSGSNIYQQCSSCQRTCRHSVSARLEPKKATIHVSFGLDLVDMQSLNFWCNTLWNQPFEEGFDFGTYAVVHPMAVATSTTNLSAADTFGEPASFGGYIVHNVTVKKVFSSMAKPAILSLSSYSAGSVVLSANKEDDTETVEHPLLIAKQGDNLINDMSVSLMFSIFNHVWQKDAQRFGGSDKVPFSFAYNVIPTGARTGLLELVAGIEPLNDYDWKTWVTDNKLKPDVLNNMLRSAAGCSVAQYILGCGDRHWDNIQIKDGHTMLHIDFGMILGENPTFKTPRFSISGHMENAFREVGIWEPFVDLCGAAFLSLKARSSELTRLIALLLHDSGRQQSRVLMYLASRESFNIDENDDEVAAKLVCDRVRQSSTHWETILRKFTHDKVDPMFFKVVELAPKSLVAAVERMYDK